MNELRSLLNSGFPIKATKLKDILESIRSENESKYYDQVLPYVMGSWFKIEGELIPKTIAEAQDVFKLCPKIPVRLSISNNNIQDISPLSELTNLTSLYLYNSNIQDISSLHHLKAGVYT